MSWELAAHGDFTSYCESHVILMVVSTNGGPLLMMFHEHVCSFPYGMMLASSYIDCVIVLCLASIPVQLQCCQAPG